MGKLIRNVVIVFSILFLVAVIMFAKGERNDFVDQSLNVIATVDPRVQSVKNAVKSDYGITYEEAFSAYFGDPAWKVFVSDDGKEVVEFTGKCYFQDARVKALIQFVINNDEGTFEAAYLSFNDVPQNKLILAALITDVFDEAVAEKNQNDAYREESSYNTYEHSSTSEMDQGVKTKQDTEETDLEIVNVFVQRDCEYLMDEYIPTIYLYGNGEFRFVCNLYEGMANYTGRWEIINTSPTIDYHFIVDDNDDRELSFHIYYDDSLQEGGFFSDYDEFGMSISNASLFYSTMV